MAEVSWWVVGYQVGCVGCRDGDCCQLGFMSCLFIVVGILGCSSSNLYELNVGGSACPFYTGVRYICTEVMTS